MFLLLLQSTGLILYEALKVYLIQCEMKNKLEEERTDWCYLKITKEEFTASLIDEHELRLDGKMYDIHSITLEDNFICIKALHDVKEETLLSELEKFLGRNSEQSREALDNLLDIDSTYLSCSMPLLKQQQFNDHIFSVSKLLKPESGYTVMWDMPPEMI